MMSKNYLKNQWEKIGTIGWDVGMIIIASPENIYALYDHFPSTKTDSVIDYIIDNDPSQLCKDGIAVLNNFGGDGAADIYVTRKNHFDDKIKIIFDDLFNSSSPSHDTIKHECDVNWENGMIFIGDPIALSDIFAQSSTLTDFLSHYTQNIEKNGFYEGSLNYILVDNLRDAGSFSIYINKDPIDGIDSIITLESKSQIAGGQQYTLAEVAKHNKKEDAWIALQGKVYNVTEWIPQHPGGDAILQCLGKDATSIFEGIGHPSYVYDHVRPQFLIGTLVDR